MQFLEVPYQVAQLESHTKQRREVELGNLPGGQMLEKPIHRWQMKPKSKLSMCYQIISSCTFIMRKLTIMHLLYVILDRFRYVILLILLIYHEIQNIIKIT